LGNLLKANAALHVGFVKNLARPGGHFLQQIELASKRLQFLKDAFQTSSQQPCFGIPSPGINGGQRAKLRQPSDCDWLA
jgi:hypothetical protein